MYIDRNAKQGAMVDKHYVFKEELKARCCSKVFKTGEVVLVYMYTSKNRLLIKTNRGGCHKVKRSSFNRTTEEYKENEIKEDKDGKGKKEE